MQSEGTNTWDFIQASFADSFLSGHESPYDELHGGKQILENPTEVFRILDAISERLRTIIETIEDPWQFYPTLMREAHKIAEGSELPEIVRDMIRRMIDNVAKDIAKIYENRTQAETPATEDGNHTAQRVMDDIKKISWVPLNNDEVLDKISVKSVPVSKVEGLSEVIPQLALLTEHSGMKGGAARLALKLFALQKMDPMSEKAEILLRSIEAEVPLADMDLVMTSKEPNPHEFAERMGVHPVDIEVVSDFGTGSLIDYLGRRDLSANQAVLTRDLLYFSGNALADFQTDPGLAQSIVPTIPGLFGRESFFVNKREYKASNTLYRLVKTVSEGKHTHFVAPRYNLDAIPLGKHWLTMARKWIKREDRAQVFAAAYSCAKQMGATKTETPEDFFEELLRESPDFTFTDQQTVLDVTKWLAKKYIIFLEKILRRKFRLQPERADQIFASTDETAVTVRPDLSNITEANLAKVENIFRRIECVEGKKDTPAIKKPSTEASPRQAIASIKARREAVIAERRQIIDEMMRRGPQKGDRLLFAPIEHLLDYLDSTKITEIKGSVAYFGESWRKRKVPCEDLRVEFFNGTKEIASGPVWKPKKEASVTEVKETRPIGRW